ncbi:hypothetical protein VB773_15010 [Haloarculaceae archaeon H-GB2-1]|nr:hypothetical protein [Haloarculaceae archaeon H-GB2-1]
MTYENTGRDPGTVTPLLRTGESVDEHDRLVLSPNESRTVPFSVRFDSPGNHTLTVNGQERTITVVEAEANANVTTTQTTETTAMSSTTSESATDAEESTSPTTDDADATTRSTDDATTVSTTQTTGPGFGSLAALLALLVGGLARHARTDDR